MLERKALALNGLLIGFVMLLALAAIALLTGTSLAAMSGTGNAGAGAITGVVLISLWAVALSGFTVIQPNEARVITLFGRYLGTIRDNGWFWTVPLTGKEGISLRIRNFDSHKLKVNDAVGNPVEIGAVIVWRVVNTAQAAFDVDDFEGFVTVQTEAAIRHIASSYPYDNYEEDDKTLRANSEEVADDLLRELQMHLSRAGVEVIDTRLTHLAYAPEIAADMLRRQQASAIVAARRRIVEGAVGMVEEALAMLSAGNIVDLDEERKANMVSNLMVVLCSESHAQPIINAGSLY